MLQTDKMYTVAGTSIRQGVLKYRFANCTVAQRTYVLQCDNHADIKLFALPHAMSTAQAITWLAETHQITAPVTAKAAPKAVAVPLKPAKAAKLAAKLPARVAEPA